MIKAKGKGNRIEKDIYDISMLNMRRFKRFIWSVCKDDWNRDQILYGMAVAGIFLFSPGICSKKRMVFPASFPAKENNTIGFEFGTYGYKE